MGTRADFYIGTGTDAEWLGSLAYDGDRINEMRAEHAGLNPDNAACFAIKNADNADDYRKYVAELLSINDDATLPAQGWPWPWNDSNTTDCAYAFVDGGCKLIRERAEWPDMTARKNVTFGERSGLLIFQAK